MYVTLKVEHNVLKGFIVRKIAEVDLTKPSMDHSFVAQRTACDKRAANHNAMAS